MQIHAVQRGENLWLISRRYGVTVSQIAEANQLPNPNQLAVGQALVIPTPDRHIVRPGETLGAIARRYGTTVEALVRENRILNPSLIYPGQVLRIPRPERPEAEANGYLTQTGAAGQQIVRNVGQYLTYLSPFSYQLRADGTLVPKDDAAVLEAARAESAAPLLVVTNFAEGRFNSELAHALFTNTAVQDRLIANLLETMRSKGYVGVNFDFEYVLPEDREGYNRFLRRAVDRLHPQGFSVSTALAPKASAEQRGLLYEAHDYPAHGEIVDFTVLMTYEWGWAGGPPLAIAPINEVRRVLDYAITVIPRDKILMGMPLYGRDWTLPYVRGGPFAATISPQEAISRAIRYGAAIQYNTLYQSPFFRYTDERGRQHEVWFEDARSVQAKFDLVKQYMLRGVSYWEISSPFPQNWLLLENNFEIVKKSEA
jgi:spore germination protein